MELPVLSTKLLSVYPLPDEKAVDRMLNKEVKANGRKIIVLDDDPTGVQTVHGVSVYTDWSKDSLRAGFAERNKLFFILTNSRGFTAEQTTKAHREIARNAAAVSKETKTPYLIVSRSDSTLRGHYPLETELLREQLEKSGTKVDGEILCPFFQEGGRYTFGNVHYVKYGTQLVPAGQTEFARDATFGYENSDLPRYIEEKTGGQFRAADVTCISLESLRALDIDGIVQQLLAVHDFGKIVVNALDPVDVKVFCIALYRAMAQGHHFLFRTAAAFVKALGGIKDKPLLARDEMIKKDNGAGGIIVVGSHTDKTTKQLRQLQKIKKIVFMEMDSDLVLQKGALEREVERLVSESDRQIKKGKTVCISTKRKLLTVPNDTPEQALVRSVQISDAVQALVGTLHETPAFVIAKGGITSSDVGVKALRVKRATVLGQIRPGIPVWKTGRESRFPGIPYIIFPGNVGEASTLREAAETLMGL